MFGNYSLFIPSNNTLNLVKRHRASIRPSQILLLQRDDSRIEVCPAIGGSISILSIEGQETLRSASKEAFFEQRSRVDKRIPDDPLLQWWR